jgi:hypothetical protein
MEISRATLSAFEPTLEYAFDLHPTFAMRRNVGTFAKGDRLFSKVAGGTVSGPLLQGEMIGGADFPLWLHGDVDYMEFDVRTLIKTADGYTIFMQNRGTLVAAPDVRKRMAADERVDPSEYYHRSTPIFDAPLESPHNWLNQHMFVASGARRHDSSAQIRVFVVR